MDHDTTPQRFPLRRLLRRINEVAGHGIRTFQVLKAQGYGRRIFDLSAQLELNESVTVDLSDLDELCGGVDEWFYDLDVQVQRMGVRFGLHDSTALFIDGEEPICAQVTQEFKDVHRAR